MDYLVWISAFLVYLHAQHGPALDGSMDAIAWHAHAKVLVKCTVLYETNVDFKFQVQLKKKTPP